HCSFSSFSRLSTCPTPLVLLPNNPARSTLATLSLHDALPVFFHHRQHARRAAGRGGDVEAIRRHPADDAVVHHKAILAQHHAIRSEEHTSELQSRGHLVCRLPPEKKKRRSPIRPSAWPSSRRP